MSVEVTVRQKLLPTRQELLLAQQEQDLSFQEFRGLGLLVQAQVALAEGRQQDLDSLVDLEADQPLRLLLAVDPVVAIHLRQLLLAVRLRLRQVVVLHHHLRHLPKCDR